MDSIVEENDQGLEEIIKKRPQCQDDQGIKKKKKQRMKKMMDMTTCLHSTLDLTMMFKNRIRALGDFNVTLVI